MDQIYDQLITWHPLDTTRIPITLVWFQHRSKVDKPTKHRPLGAEVTVQNQRCHGRAMDALVCTIVGLVVVRVIENNSIRQTVVRKQRHSVENPHGWTQ